jgi:hypothetical protein
MIRRMLASLPLLAVAPGHTGVTSPDPVAEAAPGAARLAYLTVCHAIQLLA